MRPWISSLRFSQTDWCKTFHSQDYALHNLKGFHYINEKAFTEHLKSARNGDGGFPDNKRTGSAFHLQKQNLQSTAHIRETGSVSISIYIEDGTEKREMTSEAKYRRRAIFPERRST